MRRVRLWHLSGPVSLSLLFLVGTSGCRSTIQSCTGRYLAKASTPVDYTPTSAPDAASQDAASPEVPPAPESSASSEGTSIHEASLSSTSDRATTAEESDQAEATSAQPQRFQIPKELPGADAPPLQMPPLDPTLSPDQRKSLAASLFPEIAEAAPADSAVDEHSLTLASLQQMGIENSPVIRQAAADVEAARGLAVQAGLKPNPTVGYQGDTIGTADTAGYNGVTISQEIVTAGKLTLAQNTALMEMRAKEAELRKARIELATRIRRGYFRVLVAQEQVKFNSALARLSAEVYRAQIDLVTGGEAAPYEPLQLRVFAVQARNSVIQAQNNLSGEWRQLAANMGMPSLPEHRVEGSVEAVIPAIDYDQAAALIVQKHSDLKAAQLRIAKATCNLRLQQVTPIPNVSMYAAFQHDDTSPLSDYSTNLQLSVPVPVFDRNQGNISTAHAQLVRANQDLSETQNSLLGSLADVHARRSSSLVIVNSYRSDLLPDQVRVYRGVYDRFRAEGDGIDFSQVVVAQQTLAQVVTSYLQELQTQWDSTVELAALLQIDDFMTFDGLALPPHPQP